MNNFTDDFFVPVGMSQDRCLVRSRQLSLQPAGRRVAILDTPRINAHLFYSRLLLFIV